MRSLPSVAERVLGDAADGAAGIAGGRFDLDDFLDSRLKAPEFRRITGNLLFAGFRRKRQLESMLDAMCARRPPPPEVRALLFAAAAQMLFQDAVAPQSAANVAVELAKRRFGAGTGRFVNALLRRVLRETPVFSDAPEEVLPEAVLREWRRCFPGAELRQLTEAFLTPAPFTFRAVGGFEPEAEFVCRPAGGFGPFCFFAAEDPAAVLNSAPMRDGKIYIQDPAASLAVSMADFSGVCRALDVCAAPGGKSLQIDERLEPGASLLAADRSSRRLEMARENFARHGREIAVIAAEPGELTGAFDLVLADVPCSNTGVFRRRPDVLDRFSRRALEEVAAVQRTILEAAAARVAPGGQLVYSTCSIEPEENTLQIGAFLASHREFSLRRERQLLPCKEHDGAYAALLVRSAQSI